MSTTTVSMPARTAGSNDHSNRSAGRSAGMTIVVTGLLVIVALYFIVPVYWVLVAASKTSEDLFSTFGFWFAPNFALWENLTRVVTYDNGIFVRWFLNSVLYAGVGSLIATYLAAAGGYALAKYKFKGSNLIFGIILGGVLVPGTATALPLFLLFSQLGLANTYWSVLIPSLVSPFGLFLCRIYADATVDDALLEAARLDGATGWKQFTKVTVPTIRPAIVVVLTTIAMATLKAFDIVRTMTGGNFGTSVVANDFYSSSFTQNQPGLGSALAVLLFILVSPIIVYNVRQLRQVS